MGERENTELIEDQSIAASRWNAYRSNATGNESSRVTVLHVEDHDIVARMAKEMLESEGWEVETCADGSAALEKICGPTRYDLLLLDYDLPGVNGLELVSQARKFSSSGEHSYRSTFSYSGRSSSPESRCGRVFTKTSRCDRAR